MLELPRGDIHLWLTFPSTILNPDLLDAYKQLLTTEERDQQQRFHFIEDQHRYLVTRALARTVLSQYTTTSPESWRFKKNSYGRPEIISDREYEKSLSFNISHTKDLILCGVTQQQALGVDTENFQCKPAPLDLSRYFSAEESDALYNLPKQLQQERFFHYWALKEAYIKARGMGLSLPLDQFSFDFPDQNHIRITFDHGLQDSSNHWNFWLLKPTKDHLAAVCIQQQPGVSQRLVIKESIPLQSEAPFPCMVLKQSI